MSTQTTTHAHMKREVVVLAGSEYDAEGHEWLVTLTVSEESGAELPA